MTQFRSLLGLTPGLDVGRQQLEANARLSELVRDSLLYWWELGDPIIGRGIRLLIGVAVYSDLDMELLDRLHECLQRMPSSSLRIDVFSYLSCRTQSDIEAYIPGLEKVFHTPLVGVWRDGVLQERAEGYYGRELVWKTLGVTHVALAL